jgi:hypothetical protein
MAEPNAAYAGFVPPIRRNELVIGGHGVIKRPFGSISLEGLLKSGFEEIGKGALFACAVCLLEEPSHRFIWAAPSRRDLRFLRLQTLP